MESYAGDIPQATKRSKTIKDLKIALQLVLENLPRKPIKKVYTETQNMCGRLVVDNVNTCCDALLSFFCNNYLRYDFKNGFCYVISGNTF